jgi:hypothetical protein
VDCTVICVIVSLVVANIIVIEIIIAIMCFKNYVKWLVPSPLTSLVVKVIPIITIKVCWSLKLQLHSFVTLALDKDQLTVPSPTCLIPSKIALLPMEQEARWTSQSVWMLWRRAKSLAFSGKQTTISSSCSKFLFQLLSNATLSLEITD